MSTPVNPGAGKGASAAERQGHAEPKTALDPSKFEIERIEEIGNSVVALINYPGSSAKRSRRVMLFSPASREEVESKKEINPAPFAEKGLVAQLHPTEESWETASILAQLISKASA